MKHWFDKKKARTEKLNEAKEKFTSWLDISQTPGFKFYEDEINKRMDVIKGQFENNTSLTGEELKRLQLALQVWKEVKRIPKVLEENAKAGGK